MLGTTVANEHVFSRQNTKELDQWFSKIKLISRRFQGRSIGLFHPINERKNIGSHRSSSDFKLHEQEVQLLCIALNDAG